MAAIVLFRGPGHVMEWCNDEVASLAPRVAIGAPVTEGYPEEGYKPVQAAMSECFHTGRPVILARPLGTLVVLPRLDDRRHVFGVATYFAVGVYRQRDLRHGLLHALPGPADRVQAPSLAGLPPAL
jgi:hypothetical protein